MTEITHTIDETTDEQFETAGDCAVSIRDESEGTLTVKLLPKDGSETEIWQWENDTVVSHLINGNLIPQDNNAVDYLDD